jgi:hypothetical protein
MYFSTHRNRWTYATALAALAMLVLYTNCQKETFTTDPEDRLGFSTDTLRFDTVFTQLGSATRILKIYNPHAQSIRISRIYLEQGAQSRFNINVDGLPGDEHRDLEIAPRDSMYVFAEVTVNPDQPASASPFVIDENLVFETNGNTQKVVLEAWGQNANYLPSRFSADSITGIGCNGGEWVWDDPRPYVIYGVVVIDDCTVRIPAGARVYVHGGLTRTIDPTSGDIGYYNDGILTFVGNGRLIVEGTKDNPVIFESDRLEPEFDDDPGQWTGVWLQSGTSGHAVTHCIIRNSIIGIRADSAVDLSLKNTQIYNTAGSGLIGIHANITAENCLFWGNPGFCVQLEYGGNYQFDYCTMANYGVDGEAVKLGNALCLDQTCQTYRLNRLQARFRNCILFGSKVDQFTLFDREDNPANFDYQLENCIVRVKDLLKPNAWPDFLDRCMPCLNLDNNDTIFLDINKNDFRLDSMSSKANGFAVPIPGLTRDLIEQDRDTERPDAGCYELKL